MSTSGVLCDLTLKHAVCFSLNRDYKPYCPSFSVAFKVLFLVRVLAATYSNISDCDEVFNYWEPMHYLQYGSGLETWEYSPVYAIRSWAYILVHALPAEIARLAMSANRVSCCLIPSTPHIALGGPSSLSQFHATLLLSQSVLSSYQQCLVASLFHSQDHSWCSFRPLRGDTLHGSRGRG